MLKCTCMGYLSKDAEIKSINGKEYAAFSIGINQGKDKPPIWLSCLLYNTKIANYLTKGKKIVVGGSLIPKPYLAKDGTPKAGLSLYCDYLEFAANNNTENSNPNATNYQNKLNPPNLEEEEFPF